MKYEWRKQEKSIYLPKQVPVKLTVPTYNYYTIEGKGDPNGEKFSAAVEALYAVSYGVRMSHKKGIEPKGYFEYTVYPLEGVWSLSEAGIKQQKETGVLNKQEFTFKLMIRQPDFVTKEYAEAMIDRVVKEKKITLVRNIKFEQISEGLTVQMMHFGSYDDEPLSFSQIASFCKEQQLVRIGKDHKEIYLTDPRKTSPEKNKTVLRVAVKKSDECLSN